MFTQFEISRLNREQNRYETARRRDGQPQLPKTTVLNNRIVQIAQKEGGIIAGSYALKTYNPKYRKHISDVDIIAKNPLNFAITLTDKLNKSYGKTRFRVVKGVNAYRVYDRNRTTYVADIVQYPIKQKDYSQIGGARVAKPEFVFRGKRRKARTRSGMPTLKFNFPKIKGLI